MSLRNKANYSAYLCSYNGSVPKVVAIFDAKKRGREARQPRGTSDWHFISVIIASMIIAVNCSCSNPSACMPAGAQFVHHKSGCISCIQCDGEKRLCHEPYPIWQPILGASPLESPILLHCMLKLQSW